MRQFQTRGPCPRALRLCSPPLFIFLDFASTGAAWPFDNVRSRKPQPRVVSASCCSNTRPVPARVLSAILGGPPLWRRTPPDARKLDRLAAEAGGDD